MMNASVLVLMLLGETNSSQLVSSLIDKNDDLVVHYVIFSVSSKFVKKVFLFSRLL